MSVTKTKINGKWVLDAQKDYSNGSVPKQNQQHPEVATMMTQHRAMAVALKEIATMTSAKAIHQRINALRQAWPTL